MSILDLVQYWHERTFPDASPEGIVRHIEKEIAELKLDPDDPSEVADVVILCCGYAAAKGWDLEVEVSNKHAINVTRTWKAPDAEGVVEHVKE